MLPYQKIPIFFFYLINNNPCIYVEIAHRHSSGYIYNVQCSFETLYIDRGREAHSICSQQKQVINIIKSKV